jgi:hypothetical protein
MRAGASDLEFREGAHIEEPNRIGDVSALVADILEVVRAAEAPALARTLAGRRRRVVLVQQHVRLA